MSIFKWTTEPKSIYMWWKITDMQWPCPSGFHVPTSTEFWALKTAWVAIWAWANNWWNNAKTYLKLPFAWDRNYKTASVENVNSQWYYRCCDASYGSVVNAYWYFIFSNYFNKSAFQPWYWASIRPFKDTPVIPDSNWTTLYDWSSTATWAGIFHDSTNWLISISSDGTNWITIADKNLWATEVYDSWNVSWTNRGNYYQWGNNYWFFYSWTPTSSSTQVDTTGYWPWNYYNSSTFVKDTNWYWFSDANTNLRWWDGLKSIKKVYLGTTQVRPAELPPYLCFTANTANSTVTLNKIWNPTAVTLETSTDWKTWSTYTFNTAITLSNIWDKVYWRNTWVATWFSDYYYQYKFAMTGSIAASGDINYLLNKDTTTTLVWAYTFYNLFNWCTSLTSTPSLPATTLTSDCYREMFRGCTNLTTLPELPATTLTNECYYLMFRNCSWIKLSAVKTWDYQTEYRIPTTWTGTTAYYALNSMFTGTWWLFTWEPSINTTYYTSNTVV